MGILECWRELKKKILQLVLVIKKKLKMLGMCQNSGSELHNRSFIYYK